MKHVTELVKFNLLGKDSNAFSLMGFWQKAAKKQNTPKEEIKAVLDDCMTSDYNHLLRVLMENSK